MSMYEEFDESFIGELYELLDETIYSLEYCGVALILLEETIKGEESKKNIEERINKINSLIEKLKAMRGRLNAIIKEL